MSLQKWLEYGWLHSHQSSPNEISDLLRIIDRDLQDAVGDISADWRFGIAYNAALKLCTILIYAEGYRAEKTLQHFRTLQALPLILGNHHEADAKYLDTCRNKRNVAEYDYAGRISEDDVDELVGFVKELTLQRYITHLLQCSKFPFPMREIRPMVLHLYP